MIRWALVIALIASLQKTAAPNEQAIEAQSVMVAGTHYSTPSPVAVDPGEPPLLAISVRLPEFQDWSPRSHSSIDTPDYDLIPSAEAGWPDLESADLLLQMLEEQQGDDPLVFDFLDAAQADGLLDGAPRDLDDQWKGMIALWAHYLGFTNDDGELDVDATDWQWLGEEVQAVSDADPTSAPGESLRYCLILLVAHFEVDVKMDFAETLLDLAHSDDETLALNAASDLLYIDGATLADYEKIPILNADVEHAVAQAALTQAVLDEDWASVEEWTQRLEETPELTDEDLLDIDEIRGMMMVAGHSDTTDWRAELTAAVHHCNLQTPVMGQPTLSWTVTGKTWSYDGDLEEPIHHCLERWSPSGEGPGSANVELLVKGKPILHPIHRSPQM